MGLDFSKTAVGAAPSAATVENEIEVVKPYDIAADRAQMNEALVNSKEVDDIVSTIEVFNLETIASFGSEAAEEISKASDIVLNSMNMSQLDESSEMLTALSKIMSKFDIDELKEDKGLFGKLFGNLKKQLEKILEKYHTMGGEVDKIYVQLKQYESEIKQANRKLDQMFDANVNYYHDLVKYILAGEQAGKELFRFQPQRMNYELLYQETFAEVLCPKTVYDLIDYHLRECLKREIKMRVCKNCGHLFAVTGHGGTEYCDRSFDEKGRTCKEIGAFRVWEKSKSDDEVFKVYRREYKKRFAWIRAGRITKDEFYSWSEKAREKKIECEEGYITLEKFIQWLKNS